jgi:hypothetical protein
MARKKIPSIALAGIEPVRPAGSLVTLLTELTPPLTNYKYDCLYLRVTEIVLSHIKSL